MGYCVHRIALHRSRPNMLFMQKHWDVMRSDDGGDSWRERAPPVRLPRGWPSAAPPALEGEALVSVAGQTAFGPKSERRVGGPAEWTPQD